MTATLATFRTACRSHYRHHPDADHCARARRDVLHALLLRHSPEAVMRWWLTVARVLDAVERGVRGR